MGKTKVMVVIDVKHKSQQPRIYFKEEAIGVIHNFKWLGIDMPSQHIGNICLMRIKWKSTQQYYDIKNMCHFEHNPNMGY